MKRIMTVALIAGSVFVFSAVADAKPVVTSGSPAQDRWGQPGWRDRDDRRDRRNDDRRWNRGRPYSYVTTRIVRRWFRTYRETVRVTHLPNGRVITQVIHRVRIR